ncbi:ATP-binding protein [Streptomyces sp. NPDC013953]|uniref:ATP-binding protein n=1 Tax=Streptomyces sp. NPDC013953 TaxID=3364868 RepID=UPI0036FD6590
MTIHMPDSTSTYAGPMSPPGHVSGTCAPLPSEPPDMDLDDEGFLPAGGFAACGFDGAPRNVGQARRFVAHTLDRWELPAVSGDAQVVVSELVTNAVRHAVQPPAAERDGDGPGEFPVWLGLFRHATHLVCAVSDPSSVPPRPREAGDLATGGRGLLLVGALCDTWSWAPTPPRGKTVWASLAL